jgi:hypothetical protein
MNDSAKARAVQLVADATVNEPGPCGIAENAWPWIAGFCGILTGLLYREALRLMMWARSMNW